MVRQAAPGSWSGWTSGPHRSRSEDSTGILVGPGSCRRLPEPSCTTDAARGCLRVVLVRMADRCGPGRFLPDRLCGRAVSGRRRHADRQRALGVALERLERTAGPLDRECWRSEFRQESCADPVLDILSILEADVATDFEMVRREWETACEAASCARES